MAIMFELLKIEVHILGKKIGMHGEVHEYQHQSYKDCSVHVIHYSFSVIKGSPEVAASGEYLEIK